MTNPTPSASEDQVNLDLALDKTLLDIVKNGVEVPDGDGGTVRVTASAAHLKVALARVQMLGISKTVAPGSDHDKLSQNVQRLVRAGAIAGKIGPGSSKLPDLDDEDDAATA